jgi:hypothetical protein
MAGVAAERMRVANAAQPSEIADLIREVRQEIEREPPV